MEEKIIAKIEEYDYIAIYRHVNPDFDAFGSQLGMAEKEDIAEFLSEK